MYKIAMVEDEEYAAAVLSDMLLRYGKEAGVSFEISHFQNAITFLTNYSPVFDIVFMDIELPYLNGMEAAKKLREQDTDTMLVFVTNVAQMAAKGYEVSAFDFVVKPLSYPALRMKLDRICSTLARRSYKRVTILSEGCKICIAARDILYVEVSDHTLIYHTEEGNFPAYGSMSKAKEQLEGEDFFMCNSCYLVNLRYVRRIQKYSVLVGGDELQISHPRKKAFLQALNAYIGE